MKILLLAINAKYIHTNLAVRQLSEYGKKQGIEMEYVEYTINNRLEEILNGVYKKQPDFLGISCYIWNIEIVKKLCVLIKKLLPNIFISLGGPEVSYNPEDVIEQVEADFVIRGAGEKALVSLVQAVKSGNYENVSSLTYRNTEGLFTNNVTEIVPMSEVGIGYDNFAEAQNRICYYEASRGCPFNCAYCLSSVEKGVNAKPFEMVKEDLLKFIDAKVRQVKFVDRTFNCNNKIACEIVKFIEENDNGVTNFHFEVAPDLLSDQFMSLLEVARSGLFQLEIGVQSTNEETLEAVNRHNDFAHIAKCVQRIKKNQNCHVHLDLIAGLPKEDYFSFIKSFNDVHLLFPHQLQLGFLKILHGAGMEKMCEKYGIEYSPFPPYEVMKTDCLDYNSVLRLKEVEDMVEIFYNSCRFRYLLDYIFTKCDGDYYKIYDKLSYKRKSCPTENYLANTSNCYEFLTEFAEEIGLDRKKAVMLAKLDFMCHERPHSQPSWAACSPNLMSKNDIFHFVVTEDKALKLLGESGEPKEFLKDIHVEKFPQPPLDDQNNLYIFDYRHKDIFGNSPFASVNSDDVY